MWTYAPPTISSMGSQVRLHAETVYYDVLTELVYMVPDLFKPKLVNQIQGYVNKSPGAKHQMELNVKKLCRLFKFDIMAMKLKKARTEAAWNQARTEKREAIENKPKDLCVAFVMGHHPRLGSKSPLRHLDEELLRMVMIQGGLMAVK
jgi:hypothetical protein